MQRDPATNTWIGFVAIGISIVAIGVALLLAGANNPAWIVLGLGLVTCSVGIIALGSLWWQHTGAFRWNDLRSRVSFHKPVTFGERLPIAEPDAAEAEQQSLSPPIDWRTDPLNLASDADFRTFYETKCASDPNWERALSAVANGMLWATRYERVTGRQPESLGRKRYKSVDWEGRSRGMGGAIDVLGPLCPNDQRPLFHRNRIMPTDTPAKNEDRVGGASMGELHCRDCDRAFHLDTQKNGRWSMSDPIEFVGQCRKDVLRLFVNAN